MSSWSSALSSGELELLRLSIHTFSYGYRERFGEISNRPAQARTTRWKFASTSGARPAIRIRLCMAKSRNRSKLAAIHQERWQA